MAGDKSKGDQHALSVLEWVVHHNINMCQMPCPEALYEGVKRKPQGFKYYNTKGFRAHCSEIANGQAAYMQSITEAGHTILGVLGVVFSPACSTIKDSPSPYHPYGIFMQELEKETLDLGLDLKFVCVTEKWKNKMQEVLVDLYSPD